MVALVTFLHEDASPVLRPSFGLPRPSNPSNLPWLIVGSAACVYNDLAFAPPTGPTIAVNQAATDLDLPVDIACTLCPELAQAMATTYHGRIFCSRGSDYVTDVLPVRYEWQNGTSGLYAVQIALYFGAKSIILSGMPLDDTERFHDSNTLARGSEATLAMYREPWKKYAKELRGKGVRSMSGWTRGLLGGPDDYSI